MGTMEEVGLHNRVLDLERRLVKTEAGGQSQ